MYPLEAQIDMCRANCESADRIAGAKEPETTMPNPYKVAPVPSKVIYKVYIVYTVYRDRVYILYNILYTGWVLQAWLSTLLCGSTEAYYLQATV